MCSGAKDAVRGAKDEKMGNSRRIFILRLRVREIRMNSRPGTLI